MTDIIGLELGGIDLHRVTRKREYVSGRFMAYYIIRKYLPFATYQQIGNVFNKNHATIVHGVREYPFIKKFEKHLIEVERDVLAKWTGNTGSVDLLKDTDREKIIDTLMEKNNFLTLENRRLKSTVKKLLRDVV